MQKDDIFQRYFGKNSTKHKIDLVEDIPSTSVPNNETYRAEGNINIDELSYLIKSLLDDTWEDNWGEFSDSSPNSLTESEEHIFPRITFKVLNRIPSKHKLGIKPRLMDITLDEKDSNYTLLMSRQWFDCEVEFLISHHTNKEAYELMTRFELFIEAYTGYFKRKGISEIVFLNETSVDSENSVLKHKSNKSLKYLILYERIGIERVRTTKALLTQIEANTKIANSIK